MQGEPFILKRVRQDVPSLTPEQLRRRLIKLRDQELIEYFHRHGQHRWWKRPHPEDGHGRITFQFDGNVPYVFWMDTKIRNAPVELNRFGLFNIKRFGEWVELYLSDLTVNGHKVDLSQDPQWEEKNNRASWTEPNFQAMNNYGWGQTNWAGQAPGEIGGLFWRTEPEDPHFSYYGDDIGDLSLEDPISFRGSIYFETGMTDAAAYFGYFNSQEQVKILARGDPDEGFPRKSMLGIQIGDSSAVGYYFIGLLRANAGNSTHFREKVFTPNRQRRHFTFRYDPAANNGVGRITYTLDNETFIVNVTPEQRAAGATFDRFGFANVRRGGHSVEFYLDDLTYTARRNESVRPKRFQQKVIEVEYPHQHGGRRY